MIKITFPDGSVREYNEGVNGLQIAESISSRLAQDVLACGVNGETYDLGRPINEDANFVLYKWGVCCCSLYSLRKSMISCNLSGANFSDGIRFFRK